MEEAIEKAIKEPVTAVMTQCPLSIHPDATLIQVLEQFSKQSNHPLIVIGSDGTLSGVITPMDLISALTPGAGFQGRHLISGLDRILKSTARNARDLMSDEPLTVPETSTIGDTLRSMEHAHSSSVIIVNGKKEAAGCVELSDIIAYLHGSLTR